LVEIVVNRTYQIHLYAGKKAMSDQIKKNNKKIKNNNKIRCVSPKNERQYLFLLFCKFPPEIFMLIPDPFVSLAQ